MEPQYIEVDWHEMTDRYKIEGMSQDVFIDVFLRDELRPFIKPITREDFDSHEFRKHYVQFQLDGSEEYALPDCGIVTHYTTRCSSPSDFNKWVNYSAQLRAKWGQEEYNSDRVL